MLVLVGLMLALWCASSCAGAGVRLLCVFLHLCLCVYVCFPVCVVLSTGTSVLLIML